jgi:phosphotransferase system  glucose/maltose/N-acetylglucosamine-specific IIC component
MAQSNREVNARFNAASASEEDIQYIVKLRKRMMPFTYLIWIIIGVLIYQYWSYMNWWLFIVGIVVALILGSIVSFTIGKIVESKTGYDLQTQMKIHENYQERNTSE